MLLKCMSLDYGVGFLVLTLERNLKIRQTFLFFPKVVRLCRSNAQCVSRKMALKKS